MNYTVFGEVVSGMEVVDKIAAAQTGAADRPLTDINFSIKLVE
jgi:cyclophilin family peptidyl-prolyl cis-trans isomerase